MTEIQASLAIPMQPARGSGEPTGTGSPLEPPAPPAVVSMPPVTPPRRDMVALRHEASLRVAVPAEGNDNAVAR